MTWEKTRGLSTAIGLATGVVAVSFAAILIRSAEAPAMVIAVYRMGIAALLVGPAAAVMGGRGAWAPHPRDAVWCLGASAFLAAHFALWIASLQHTSVTSSVVLVSATPLMVAVASRTFLREPLAPRVWVAIFLGFAGSLIIALGDLVSGGRDDLLGDALALLGAVAMSGYLLIGRGVRPRIRLMPYLALVYPGSALFLLAGVAVTGESLTGYSSRTYLFLILVALVPQLIGHSLLNWSLARVTATLVSVAVMAEPVVSSLLALILLGEAPSAISYTGSAIVLSGVFLALTGSEQVMGNPKT